MRPTKQAEQRLRAQSADAVVGVDTGSSPTAWWCAPMAAGTPSLSRSPPRARDSKRPPERIRALSGGASPADILVGIEFAGVYDFTLAHFLHRHGFAVVSVLAAHTKRWKEVMHNQALKTDQKDAATITTSSPWGQYVAFPFLQPAYAELRYLVSARGSLCTQRGPPSTGSRACSKR